MFKHRGFVYNVMNFIKILTMPVLRLLGIANHWCTDFHKFVVFKKFQHHFVLIIEVIRRLTNKQLTTHVLHQSVSSA
jgi:hypothetical protein